LLLCACGQSLADTQAEIRFLLAHIEQSNCLFWRNGEWHVPDDAREHIEQKYQTAERWGFVDSAEDFIHYAATESTISGDPYKVQCDGQAEMASADWLTHALKTYRQRKLSDREN